MTILLNPTSPMKIRKRILEYAGRPTPAESTRGKVGIITGAITRALRDVNNDEGKIPSKEQVSEYRYLLYGFLFTPDDEPLRPFVSADLTPQMINGLWRWLGPEKPQDTWTYRKEFTTECRWTFNRARFVKEVSDVHASLGITVSMRDVFANYGALMDPKDPEPEVVYPWSKTNEESGLIYTALQLGGDIVGEGEMVPALRAPVVPAVPGKPLPPPARALVK